MQLEVGDSLLLYTDGFSEALDGGEMEYGADRVARLLSDHHELSPSGLLDACMCDWLAFGDGRRTRDDVTLMAIQRTH